MTKEALITNVSCNLQKQAGIAYAIGIENVRIPFYQAPSDFFCEEYTTLWRKHGTVNNLAQIPAGDRQPSA
ncbi:hypothetical protein [Adlercreutzia sp. CNCM I-6207]